MSVSPDPVIEGMDALMGEYVADATERIARVEDLVLRLAERGGRDDGTTFAPLKAELHTLKGNSGMMGLSELQGMAHAMEDRLADSHGRVDVAALLAQLDDLKHAFRAATGTEVDEPASVGAWRQDSVRVPFATLDGVVAQLAEMVLLRNRLVDAVSTGHALDPRDAGYAARGPAAWNDAELSLEALVRVLDSLQESVLELRMVPLGSLFGSLKRLVYDEAKAGRKEATLQTVGGDTALDKALLELANEALGHLVRNAVVHGLESPAVRERHGKPRAGVVRVVAAAKADEVQIEVIDDGGGVDFDNLRASAAARGVDTATLDDPTALLFMPGVSTHDGADVSAGRGVGLSAVLEAVRRQGGEIDVDSTPGVGTRFALRLPLNVSIARAMLITVDGEVYALPFASVVENRRLRPGEGHEINHAGVIQWRGRVLPLVDLGQQFGTSAGVRADGYVIIIEANGRHRGIVVDAVAGVQEIVVRPLDKVVGEPAGIGGSTVLGDGRPVLMLDARQLVDLEPFVKEAA